VQQKWNFLHSHPLAHLVWTQVLVLAADGWVVVLVVVVEEEEEEEKEEEEVLGEKEEGKGNRWSLHLKEKICVVLEKHGRWGLKEGEEEEDRVEIE
jgi:hypothetical protein